MPVEESHILYQHVRRVVLDADVVVAACHEAIPHRDVVGAHEIDLVLPRRVPGLAVGANSAEFNVARLLRVVAVHHCHVADKYILAVVDKHHTGEVR